MRTIDLTISDKLAATRAVADFEKQCERLSIPNQRDIVQNVRAIACDLERRGKELASIGSQFKTVRVLPLGSVTARITATYGIPCRKTPFEWLLSLLPWRQTR